MINFQSDYECSGYMSPEYAIDGICSTKSDVFSFGVLLLEIVSGKKNSSFHDYEGPIGLRAYVSSTSYNSVILDCLFLVLDVSVLELVLTIILL